ncbi:MAG: RNA methyltransferase [Candidatus Omnitrophica bacterium]|nr:RNA methyltransferase [Candidatus Omnitrophota bacterium]
MIRKLSHEEIVSRQVSFCCAPRIPLVVILNDIRSLLNVGAIFRVADGVGVEKIFLCGITGYPPQGGIAKTALGAEENVPWEYHRDAVSVINSLKIIGYEIVALEQAQGAFPFEQYKPKGPTCLLLGNEVEGIADELVNLCDTSIEIKMLGVKNSLNVAVAFGVAAFTMREKFGS